MSIFNKKIWPRKFLASLLVIGFLISAFAFNVLLPQRQAKAINSTLPMQIVQWIQQIVAWYKDYSSQKKQQSYQKTTSDIQEWFKSDTLDRRSERESWNETRKDLLDELTNDVMDMAKGQNGDTSFVSDWTGFLAVYTEQAFQSFVDNGLNQAQMCNTFQSEVQQEISAGNEPPYATQAQCPSNYDSSALLNGTSQNFWSDWNNMLRPSGNPFGAYMIAEDKKLETEGLAYTNRFGQLIANQGFQGTVNTPGIVQSYATQRASMMDLDYLINSPDLEDYFSSVADAFINQITNQGIANLNTTATRPITTYPPVVSPQTASMDFINTNYNRALLISDQLALTLEDLQGLQTAGSSTVGTLIAQTSQAITDVRAMITTMENAMRAATTGNQAQIDAAVAIFNNAYATALSSLQTLFGTTETSLQRISSLIDPFDEEIVRETNALICLQSPVGCLMP